MKNQASKVRARTSSQPPRASQTGAGRKLTGKPRGYGKRNLAKEKPASQPLPYAGTETLVRLNKYLADCGVASRRKCDELITDGLVSIDGQPVTELGLKVNPSAQRVEVSGVVLKPETQRLRYYLLNKPRGVVCTNEEREARARAIDLITDRDKGRIYSVGRLDEDSEGLLILTNDGAFAQAIAHPRHGVSKTYLVKVRGRVEAEALDRIRRGVHLSEGRTGRVQIYMERSSPKFSTLVVTLQEGKNREVRRLFASVGYAVMGLMRTRIGTLQDRKLRTGHWRPLAAVEVRELWDSALGESEDTAPAPKPRTQAKRQHGERPGTSSRRTRAKTREGDARQGERQADTYRAETHQAAGYRAGAYRDERAPQGRFVAHPLAGAGSRRRSWPSPIRAAKGTQAESEELGEARKRERRATKSGPRQTVVQRRLGKAKKGKDKGAPTRGGKRR